MNDYDDGYGENDWRDNKDNLMWRYWAAKEMACEMLQDSYDLDSRWGMWCFQNYLAQLLKKEWFRK